MSSKRRIRRIFVLGRSLFAQSRSSFVLRHYYATSGNDLGASPYGRLDIALSKAILMNERRIDGRIRLSRLNNPMTTYYRGAGSSLGSNSYNGRFQVHADIRVLF